MPTRRSFCFSSFAVTALAAMRLGTQSEPKPLPPWQHGSLDLHHISTGRGNSMLAICPDGTAILIDAGSVRNATAAMGPALPNASRRPGEWIARYVLHQLKPAPRQELDYLILTHFHGDHMGDLDANSPLDRTGAYHLTGVSDVAELISVRTLIDRNYPSYDYPAPQTLDAALNYIRFARSLAAHGTRVERLRPGSASQIVEQHTLTPGFSIRNLASNGEIWTGHAENTRQIFPPLSTLAPVDYPHENSCSIALRFDYGRFRYYIGGDLDADNRYGSAPWADIESPVSAVAGPVSVAALDHHGYFDATGEAFVRNMRARIYIAQTWHASHPALPVLDRLYSPVLYPGPRDVLATDLVEPAAEADDRYAPRMLSQHGHIVVRVASGGNTYEIFVLDDTTEDGLVKAHFGPFTA